MTTSSKTNMNALKKDFQMRFTWKQSGYRNMRDRCTQELWQWIQTAISKAYEKGKKDVHEQYLGIRSDSLKDKRLENKFMEFCRFVELLTQKK